MKLGEILEKVQNSDFERLGVINDVEVHGLSYDSRLITIGDLFFCFQGEKNDSHDFVYDAIKGGASALVVERVIDIDFPQVISSNSRKMMSEIAEIFYDFPSREITTVGVTGTNGKTTVSMMINQMLNKSGIKTKAVGNTDTPLVEAIQDESLAKFVVEASSFRLGQSYNFAPDVGVWLNFSPDHLDVHKDLKSYELAKAQIWGNLSGDQVALANEDDAIVMSHRPVDGVFRTIGLDKGNSKVSPAPARPNSPINSAARSARQIKLIRPRGLVSSKLSLGL